MSYWEEDRIWTHIQEKSLQNHEDTKQKVIAALKNEKEPTDEVLPIKSEIFMLEMTKIVNFLWHTIEAPFNYQKAKEQTIKKINNFLNQTYPKIIKIDKEQGHFEENKHISIDFKQWEDNTKFPIIDIHWILPKNTQSTQTSCIHLCYRMGDNVLQIDGKNYRLWKSKWAILIGAICDIIDTIQEYYQDKL